jgi:hypothetical protein
MVGDIKSVAVAETVVAVDGGTDKGVEGGIDWEGSAARGVSPGAQAARPRLSPRLTKTMTKSNFCNRRLNTVTRFCMFLMRLNSFKDSLQRRFKQYLEPLAVYQKNMDASRKESAYKD